MTFQVSEDTYGPAEVAAAIGVKRGTLLSWLARRYVPVESRGAGIERLFTFEQVVYLAALAALAQVGIEVGNAIKMIDPIKDRLMSGDNFLLSSHFGTAVHVMLYSTFLVENLRKALELD